VETVNEIVTALECVSNTAAGLLDYFDDHPEDEENFQELVTRYGRLLMPMLKECVAEGIHADTTARIARLEVVKEAYKDLCEDFDYVIALELVQLAFK
jgi:hypothetical protein